MGTIYGKERLTLSHVRLSGTTILKDIVFNLLTFEYRNGNGIKILQPFTYSYIYIYINTAQEEPCYQLYWWIFFKSINCKMICI